MKNGLAAVLGMVFLAFSTGSSSAELAKADTDAIRASLAQWKKAAMASDTAKLATLYTKDAILLPPNLPAIEGSDAIAKHFASFPSLKEMDLEVLEIDGNADFAFVRGTYRLVLDLGEDGTLSDRGKFLEIRKKGNGEWKLYRDMYSSDLGMEDSTDHDEHNHEGHGH